MSQTHLESRETAQDWLGRNSAAKFRALLEAVPDAVVIANREGTMLLVNVRVEKLFGYHRSELLGKPIETLIPERFREKHPMPRLEHFDLPENGAERTGLDLYGRHKDGSEFPMEIFLSPLRTDDAIVVCIRDTTDRQQTEELRMRAIELTRSNADLEQFAYVASHDLQEPLRMVGSYVQLLEKKYKNQLAPEADRYIAYAVEGVTRMRQLIAGLLDYSGLAASDPPRPVSLALALEQALRTLHGAIEETGAQVVASPLPMVVADVAQLARLFQNLIDNAIKYRSSSPPHVDIRTSRLGQHWTVRIADNGIGFEPSQAERIFRIFQRLHSREVYSGSGIGLAIAKKIVERHGGRIWAESHTGHGACFYFTIPAWDDDPQGVGRVPQGIQSKQEGM